MIADAAEREIDSWPVGRPFALAPRMQAITLDVIMAGIFGIEGRPRARHARARAAHRRPSGSSTASTWPIAQVAELMNIGRDEPVGLDHASALALLDRPTYAVIAKRRRAGDLDERRDILSLLLQARTEDGEALTDRELRDELLTLVLAGHETTANSLAWTWERLVRTPGRLRAPASRRSAPATRPSEAIEATITEAHALAPGDPDHRPPREACPGGSATTRVAGRHAGG